jgi:superfamily II DNA or RNA helicase
MDYGWEDAASYCTLIHGKSADKLSKKKIEELKRLSLGEEATLKQVTISTWQSLRLKDDSFFKVFTAVLVDEAHSAKGEELRTILAKCVNANNFKVGFSGTLPDADLCSDDVANHIDAGKIEGGLGPKHDIVHLKELIAKGILPPLEVKAIFIPYPVRLRPAICADKFKYDDERAIVTENSSRKDVIDMLFTGGRITTAQNTVILYNYKEHMYGFLEFMKENKKDIVMQLEGGAVLDEVLTHQITDAAEELKKGRVGES